jgi:hypothetical protein
VHQDEAIRISDDLVSSIHVIFAHDMRNHALAGDVDKDSWSCVQRPNPNPSAVCRVEFVTKARLVNIVVERSPQSPPRTQTIIVPLFIGERLSVAPL